MPTDNVTNWKAVAPKDKKRLAPLVRHYMSKAHPWRSCVRDNIKRFGKERAERICSVVKDIGHRSTKWRGKDEKKLSLDQDYRAELDRAAEQLYLAADGDIDALEAMYAAEADRPVDQSMLTLALIGARSRHGVPAGGLSLAIAFNPKEHPRDLKGRFRSVVGGLKSGESVRLPDGMTVKRSESGFTVDDKKGTNIVVRSARDAADAALERSAKSSQKDSLGGGVKHRSVDDAMRTEKARAKDRDAASVVSERMPADEDLPEPDEDFIDKQEDQETPEDVISGERAPEIPSKGRPPQDPHAELLKVANRTDDVVVERQYNSNTLLPREVSEGGEFPDPPYAWMQLTLIDEDDGSITALLEALENDGSDTQPIDSMPYEQATAQDIRELAQQVGMID